MALSPIKMFQGEQNSLAAILQGGNNTITRIMDQAIQIGRDISNKQLAQERDLLAMRQQETAMFQRRAENLDQGIRDTQRFARNAFESDRKFSVDEAYRQQQLARQERQDAFGNQMDVERLGLAQNADMRANQLLDLSRENAEFQRERYTTQDQQRAEEMQREREAQGQISSDVRGMFAPVEKVPSGVPVVGSVLDFDTSGINRQKASNVLANPEASASQQSMAGNVLESLNASGAPATGEKPLTQAQQEDLQYKKDRNAKAREERMQQDVATYVVANRDAFPPSRKDISETDQIRVEWAAARAAQTEEEYVAKLPGATPAQIAKRRELWRKANGGTSSTTATADPVADTINKYASPSGR